VTILSTGGLWSLRKKNKSSKEGQDKGIAREKGTGKVGRGKVKYIGHFMCDRKGRKEGWNLC